VLALSGGDGVVVVDNGAPKSGARVMARLKDIVVGAKVQTVIRVLGSRNVQKMRTDQFDYSLARVTRNHHSYIIKQSFQAGIGPRCG
jgi:hypothetical protein